MEKRRQYGLVIASLGVALIWVLILRGGSYPGPPGNDFYQLWLGARSLLTGASPYGEAVQREMSRAYGEWGQHGLPYPLPAIIAIVPLAILPLGVALLLWLGLSLAAIGCSALLNRNWHQQLALPLLFLPLFRTAGLRQPTLMWVGLATLLVLALQRRWSILAGFCLALLPAKPQAGLIFALAGTVWALYYQRRAFKWALIWGIGLWGGSFLLVPNWLNATFTSMMHYSVLYPAPSLLPLGLLVILAAYRLPWWGIAAVAQVILFPIRDVYATLPLLLGWAAIGGPLALLGASFSWLWIVPLGSSIVSQLWLSILLPFAAAALWRGIMAQRGRQSEAPAPSTQSRDNNGKTE